MMLNCPCGQTIVDCCPSCCDCENSQCEGNPCELLSCLSDQTLECRPNYCDGNCGHQWVDVYGTPASCEKEVFVKPFSFLFSFSFSHASSPTPPPPLPPSIRVLSLHLSHGSLVAAVIRTAL